MTTVSPESAAPVPAATLVLLRQSDRQIETYLLRRSHSSSFMPGTYVFPGGQVDADDRNVTFWQEHTDTPVDRLGSLMDGRPDRMLPLAVAAIRETWEEAGLLMAVPAGRIANLGAAATAKGSPFSQIIAANDLSLSVSRLGSWRRWITPAHLRRRFDTYFFVAAIEPGETCRPDRHEVVDGRWITPKDALRRNLDGELPLSPPTLVTLHQLLDCNDLTPLMDQRLRRSWPPAIVPRWLPLENGALIIEPWDPAYPMDTIRVDARQLENDLLPVGAPFSRLWVRGGLCRPVETIRG